MCTVIAYPEAVPFNLKKFAGSVGFTYPAGLFHPFHSPNAVSTESAQPRS